MTMPVIENTSFALPAEKLKSAVKWWRGKSEGQQKALVREYRIVTWEHVINAWEREIAKGDE